MSENLSRPDEADRRPSEKSDRVSRTGEEVDGRGHGHHRDRESPPERRGNAYDHDRENRYDSYRKRRDHDRGLDRRDHRERHRHRERGRGHYADSRHRRRSPSKSPSPVVDFANHKRWTGWDQPIPRFFQPTSLAHGPSHQSAGGLDWISHSGASPAHMQAIHPGMAPSLAGAQADYQHSQQAKQQRRLYLGNLPPVVINSELVEFLNQAMRRIPGIDRDGEVPVVGIDMASDRNYAFLELRTLDEATYMTALDGISYKGYSLRIRRPREWQPTGKEPTLPNIPVSTLGIVSTTVVDSPNKIFIGGLPPQFVESDVKELLVCVGALKAFNLVRDTAGNSKFAFCEYIDPELTDVACKTLNGQMIGDRKLVVQRSAPTKEKDHDEFGASHDGTALSTADGPGGALSLDSLSGISLLQRILTTAIATTTVVAAIVTKAMQTPDVLKPTKILALLNALDISDEWSDAYYEFFCEDMRNECSKYGHVMALLVPRAPPRPKKKKSFLMPGQLSESDIGGEKVKPDAERFSAPCDDKLAVGRHAVPAGFGRVFVEYETVEEAARAQEALSGRNYDGRSLISSFAQRLPSS